MSKHTEKSLDLSFVDAGGGVQNAARITSSNIVATDSRNGATCVSPVGTFRTPPPPSFKPPRWTQSRQSSSDSPRGTPSGKGARAAADIGSVQRERNVGHTYTEGHNSDSDTSTPLTEGDHRGRPRSETT